jgi:hypothetical protein
MEPLARLCGDAFVNQLRKPFRMNRSMQNKVKTIVTNSVQMQSVLGAIRIDASLSNSSLAGIIVGIYFEGQRLRPAPAMHASTKSMQIATIDFVQSLSYGGNCKAN